MQKLELMQMTNIVRFDWSAVFESFWYQKLAPLALFGARFWCKSLIRSDLVCYHYYTSDNKLRMHFTFA